jgi:hypothetical protein
MTSMASPAAIAVTNSLLVRERNIFGIVSRRSGLGGLSI